MANLVIVESPTKVGPIKKYLGSKTDSTEKATNQIKPAEYFFVQYFLTDEDSRDETKVLSLLDATS